VNSANRTVIPLQRPALVASVALSTVLFIYLFNFGSSKPWLFLIGIGLGLALYHAAFGFTSAYRRAILQRDISGVTAQMVMLAAAMLLFAPVLAAGQIFGHGVTGAVAPVSISMAFGALIFGIGMQMGGACASGTLLTVGGGNLRMLLVLVFFCLGTFWASLHMQWWTSLPGIGAVSLAGTIGMRLIGGRNQRELWWNHAFSWGRLARGPWPLLLGAGALAGLNWLTLLVAGIHPVGGQAGIPARVGPDDERVLERQLRPRGAVAFVARGHHLCDELRHRHRRTDRRGPGRQSALQRPHVLVVTGRGRRRRLVAGLRSAARLWL
jgi:uncharacterized membrane protein YedE/YeeE